MLVAACRLQAEEEGGCSGRSCGKAFPVEHWKVDEAREGRDPDAQGVCGVRLQQLFAVCGNVS